MTNHEIQLKEYLENDYDINDHIDFIEESQEFNIEIETGSLFAEVKLRGSQTTSYEEGGEPDEFLFSGRDKSLELVEISVYSEDDKIETSKIFRTNIENLLNNQLYED